MGLSAAAAAVAAASTLTSAMKKLIDWVGEGMPVVVCMRFWRCRRLSGSLPDWLSRSTECNRRQKYSTWKPHGTGYRTNP